MNDIWRYLTITWRYLTTETFALDSENYRPKDIVKYRHLSPSGNRALSFSINKSLQNFEDGQRIFQLSNDSSSAFVIVMSIMFISTKLAYFLISKEKSSWFINSVISFWRLLFLIRKYFLTSKGNSNFCWGLMLLTVSQSTNISFSFYTRSESRKWMGICRFKITNILLFNFRLTVFWSFR